MSRPLSSPTSRAVAVAAGLLAVVCAAVVTGSAVGTLTAPDRVTTPVAGPRQGAAPSSAPAAPQAGGDGVLADPAGDAVVAASTRTTIALGSAGSVVLVVDGGRLRVESVAPAQGWQVDRVEDGGDRVEVRLRGGGDARLEARVVGGKVVVDRVRAPGA